MGTAGNLTDVRPFIRTSDKSIFTEGILLLNSMAERAQQRAQQHGYDVVIERSAPGQLPLFMQFEAWLPAGNENAFRQVFLQVALDLNAFTKNRVKYFVSFQAANKPRKKAQLQRHEFGEIEEWVDFIFGGGRDPAKIHTLGLFKGGLPAGWSKLLNRHTDELSQEYKGMRFNPLSICASAVFVCLLLLSSAPAFAILVGIPVGAIWIWLYFNRKVRQVIVAAPDFDPRLNRIVDNWHASVTSMGSDAAGILSGIVSDILSHYRGGVKFSSETYRYRGPHDFVERTQAVFALNQAIVYIHCYDVGGDLFIGWDACLNLARWGTRVVNNSYREGEMWELKMPSLAYYQPNEYDLIDVSSLSETIHGRIRQLINKEMKARDILDEIDFSVVRGDRAQALSKNEHEKSKPLFRAVTG
jgi:hypothetical protein